MKNNFRSLVDQRLASVRWTPELQNTVSVKIKRNRPLKKRLSFALLVCIILLSISIAALACTLPKILLRMYPNESGMNENQIALVQPIAASTTVHGVTISIDESIYDGQRLAVYWTMTNTNDIPILITQEQGNTFNSQALYPDFSSLGICEGQIILPKETLDGGFISVTGYSSSIDINTVQLAFHLFSLQKSITLLSSDAKISDEQYVEKVIQLYQEENCIVVDAETREIVLNPSLNPEDFDTESTAAFTNEYEMYGLAEKLEDLTVTYSVDSSGIAKYSNIPFQQTITSDAYPVTLSAVTLSPITTYFAFTIKSKAVFSQDEAIHFNPDIVIEYSNRDGTALDFLDGDFMSESSILQYSNGEYCIVQEYPLPGLQQIPNQLTVRLRLQSTGEIISEYLLTLPE